MRAGGETSGSAGPGFYQAADRTREAWQFIGGLEADLDLDDLKVTNKQFGRVTTSPPSNT